MDPENEFAANDPSRPQIGHGSLWIGSLTDLGPEAVAFFAAQMRNLELSSLIALSPLVRVVPVGAAVANHGVTVELLALEIREAGVRAWLRFAPTDQDSPDVVRPGHPVIEAHDRDGTNYEVGVELRARAGLAGEVEALLVPRPPAGIAELMLAVTRFVAPPFPPPPVPQPPFQRPIDGPWAFAIQLVAAT
jgi:hypothetical protein